MLLLRNARMIWAAMLLGQAQFVGIVAAGLLGKGVETPDPSVPIVAGVVAFGVAIVSFVLPSVLGRASVARAAAALREAPRAEDRGALLEAGVRAAFVPFILSLALSEFVSLMGILVAIFGHPFLTTAPFFGLGAMLVLVRFPTEASFVGPLERAL